MPDYDHVYDERDDFSPDKAADRAHDELSEWARRLEALKGRLAALQGLAEDAEDEVRAEADRVDEARDAFLDYYAALDNARNERVPPNVDLDYPPDPDEISASLPGEVEEFVRKLEEMLEAYAQVKACQNPKCGRRFLASRYTRDKLYCGAYCRVQAHRLRQQAGGGGGGEG